MKTYKVETDFGTYEVKLGTSEYLNNGSLAIQLIDAKEYEPFATLTVNIDEKGASKETAYVDINNCPWAKKFIEDNELGEFTGKYGKSGFCVYPLYKFNLDKIKEVLL